MSYNISDEEKVRRYNELYSWFLWLEHRTNDDGKIPSMHVNTFLRGIKKYFEPIEEAKDEGSE